jgi:LPXTG-motif cell wall-anchored protein
MCCIAGETSFCTECCEDSDCGDCEICDSGVCAPKSDCCRSTGQTCGEVVPTADGADQYDCCDGLICCDNLYYGASVCAECCVDHDCPHGGQCDQGECKHVCKNDQQCPWGTCCCNDGTCSSTCCHHPHPHPKPPKPKPSDAPVTSLPATGVGETENTGGLLGITLGVAAAAFVAGKKLRETPDLLDEE